MKRITSGIEASRTSRSVWRSSQRSRRRRSVSITAASSITAAKVLRRRRVGLLPQLDGDLGAGSEEGGGPRVLLDHLAPLALRAPDLGDLADRAAGVADRRLGEGQLLVRQPGHRAAAVG